MNKKANPRRANGSKRTALMKRMRALGEPCALCGKPIDYTLKTPDPLSFEVDEIVPVSLGGDPLDWTNLQPAHRICNVRKGATLHPVFIDTGVRVEPSSHKSGAKTHLSVKTSRDWSA